MEKSSYQLFGLFGVIILLMFGFSGSVIWFSKHDPHTPKFNLYSVALQNINISSNQATADWNFNFLIQNTNKFGWSYEFVATLYNDGTSDSGREDVVQFASMETIVPTFTQSASNYSAFTVRFEGVSMLITNKWLSNQESGVLVDVPLLLSLEGNIEPIPKGRLPKIIRCLASPIHVDCQKVKIGISRDSSGAIYAYLGRGSHCSSTWNSFLLK